MKIMKKPFQILSFYVFFSCFSYAASASGYSAIYVFGDSLSDTGNLASTPEGAGLNGFPFFAGRLSNGPLSIEFVAERFGLSVNPSLHLIGPVRGTNFAVAGATASGNSAIDLSTQLSAFLGSVNYTAPADALYVIYIGGTDIRIARNIESRNESNAIIRNAANNIENTILTLINAGAKKFFVINSPNVGTIPETRSMAISQNKPELTESTTRLTRKLNRKIARRVEEIRDDVDTDSDLALVLFDVFNYYDFLLDNSNALGFTNDEDACFFTNLGMFNTECAQGQNFDRFAFFDEVHPSARAHRRAGDAFHSAVPEPSSAY